MANLERLNSWSESEARKAFLRCCEATRWAEQITARRPFASESELFAVAGQELQALTRVDWLEAFAAHPKIGDLESLHTKYANTAGWAAGEQAGVAGASEAVLWRLAEGNREYEAKFGFVFIICAAGKSADEMLALLEQRLKNDLDHEFLIATGEQVKITHLRLQKLLL